MKGTARLFALGIALAAVIFASAGAGTSNAESIDTEYWTTDRIAGEIPEVVHVATHRHMSSFDFRHHNSFPDRNRHHFRSHRHGHHHHHFHHAYPVYPVGYYDRFGHKGSFGHLTLCFRGSGVQVCYSDRLHRHNHRG